MNKESTFQEMDLLPHPGRFAALGIAMIALGAISMIYSGMSTLASVIVYGWLLIFAGVFEIGVAFWAPRAGRLFLHLLSGTLSAIVGIFLIARPTVGAEALTLVLAVMFLASGAYRVGAAFAIRFPYWGWAVLSGIVTAALGLLIWAQWPTASMWIIGTFVGIDLVFRGWAWVMLAIAVSKARHDIGGTAHAV